MDKNVQKEAIKKVTFEKFISYARLIFDTFARNDCAGKHQQKPNFVLGQSLQ